MDTVLLTGGRGFIGRNLAAQLSTAYQVLAPHHEELDAVDPGSVDAYFAKHPAIQYVIHAANVGGTRKSASDQDVVERNVRMYLNLERWTPSLRHLITLGSGAEYGKPGLPPLVSEDEFGTRLPEDPYGFSKYTIAKLAARNPKITTVRLFAVFGPDEDYEFRFISNAIVKNLLGLPITIQQNVVFDYLYIRDAVQLIQQLLPTPLPHRAINLTTGRPVDLVTIANLINETADRPSPIHVIHPGLNAEYSGHNGRLLAWSGPWTFTPLKTAIQEMRRYLTDRLPSLNVKMIQEDPYSRLCAVTPRENQT